MKILARYQAMASSEILELIPTSEYQRIRATDAHPVFRAYVIGHEGESTGKVLGAGHVIARWFRTAVENLYERLRYGTKIFHDHGATNEHDGRTAIGEVVGKALRRIRDKLSAVAVAYIRPEFRNLPLDVASIEADILFREDKESNVYDADVNEVSGIALGNSAVNTPGFANATLLSQVQAFAQEQGVPEAGRKYRLSKPRENRLSQFNSGEKSMTIEEVKEFLKSEGLRPSDVFGRDTLAEDPLIKGLLKDAAKEASVSEYAHRKRIEDDFTKKKTEWETEKTALTAKLTEKDAAISLTRVPSLFEKNVTDRKLTDQQKKFITARLPDFKPLKVEDIEKEFGVFVDRQIDEFKRNAEIFGIKIDDVKKDKDGKPLVSGAEPKPEHGGGVIEDKYLDPEQNPFIPRV